MDKMRKNILKWFGHTMKLTETNAVRVVIKINVVEKRRRRRPIKRWLDSTENDMRAVGVCVRDEKIETSGGLGQSWPTPNSWEEGEGE